MRKILLLLSLCVSATEAQIIKLQLADSSQRVYGIDSISVLRFGGKEYCLQLHSATSLLYETSIAGIDSINFNLGAHDSLNIFLSTGLPPLTFALSQIDSITFTYHPVHLALCYPTSVKVYLGSTLIRYNAIGAMDTDGTNQTILTTLSLTSNAAVNYTSWSPDGTSICFSVFTTIGGIDSLRAIDIIADCDGNMTGGNLRTICTLPASSIGKPAWSSTTAMGKIAFITTDGNYAWSHLNIISDQGGKPKVVFSYDTSYWHRKNAQINSPTWSPDDTRLAIVRIDSTNAAGWSSTILIFNTSDWTIADSINFPGKVWEMEWSRNGTNKLAINLLKRGSKSIYLYFCDPKTGAIPYSFDTSTALNPVSGITWSPNNSSLIYVPDGPPETYKITAFTDMLVPLIYESLRVSWKR